MEQAEKILDKFAKKNMITWDKNQFKKTHKLLHKSIIEAITEALNIGKSNIDIDNFFCEKHYYHCEGRCEIQCKECDKNQIKDS